MKYSVSIIFAKIIEIACGVAQGERSCLSCIRGRNHLHKRTSGSRTRPRTTGSKAGKLLKIMVHSLPIELLFLQNLDECPEICLLCTALRELCRDEAKNMFFQLFCLLA
jgi:hypothetical protein